MTLRFFSIAQESYTIVAPPLQSKLIVMLIQKRSLGRPTILDLNVWAESKIIEVGV